MLSVSVFSMIEIDQKVLLAEIPPPSVRLHLHDIGSIVHLIVDVLAVLVWSGTRSVG
jgi:hypothetical protein